jgi:hypothetical protein
VDDAVDVTLGRPYEPTMWDLHKAVAAARKTGKALVFVDVRAPINSPVVRLALRSRDLYLIGLRPAAQAWYEFAPDTDRSDPGSTAKAGPMLTGSRWIKVGGLNALSSYVGLQLPGLIERGQSRYADTPLSLVAFFSAWNGRIETDYTRLRVCVLIFIICEALRFRSIETAARNWLSPLPSAPAGQWPMFEITRGMLDLARSWHDMASSGHPDVQTRLGGMPDPLID